HAINWETEAIIYGCSHYPFLNRHLEKIWTYNASKHPVKWINPAIELANTLSIKYKKRTTVSEGFKHPKLDVYITKESKSFTEITLNTIHPTTQIKILTHSEVH
ncbi:hypothetical protein HOH45_06055, partial [bacterium]|nr:hypothetical protein [bacterium]